MQKGIYQHYKGNFYEVIDVAKNTETLEECVVYRALYGDFDLWIRPLQMFLENVEYNGKNVKRFTFISNQHADEFLVKHLKLEKVK